MADILVRGVMEEARLDHDDNLVKLLHRAKEQNLKLNKEKMFFHLTELVYIL